MRAILALALGACLVSSLAAAQDHPSPLNADELDDQRGGFKTPTGLDVGFGAVVTTYVDGDLALQTRFTWTATGPVKTLEAGANTPNLAAAGAAHGIDLNGHVEGVVLPGEGGATAVLHDLAGDRIADVVINTANNRSIRQTTDVTLNLPNLAQMQARFASQQTDLRLQSAVATALADATRR